jgi:hypothetical protein
MQFECALLGLALIGSCAAQSPKSITYLRLSQPIVEQRLQTPATSEDWSAALRKQYVKAGIPAYQIVEQSVPGSSQKMVMCTIAGRSDSTVIVSASLARPKDDDAASVAWASLAMLPLLAESLNAVSTDSSIVFIAFTGDARHHPGSSWYAHQLSEAQRKKAKAAIEIAGVGRGNTTFDIKHGERYLAEWLATSALALRLPPPLTPAYEGDAAGFTDAKAFRSAGVPAITVSSQPQRVPHSFSAGYTPVNKLITSEYYSTYQLLCVFLLDLDREARGVSPKSAIIPAGSEKAPHRDPIFTEDQADRMIFGQVNDARTDNSVATLRWATMPELQGMVCDMVRTEHLATGPFESYLKLKQISGVVAVFNGSYPSLTPEQLQGLKVGRFHQLSVATCVVPSTHNKGPTYWIAALAYE